MFGQGCHGPVGDMWAFVLLLAPLRNCLIRKSQYFTNLAIPGTYPDSLRWQTFYQFFGSIQPIIEIIIIFESFYFYHYLFFMDFPVMSKGLTHGNSSASIEPLSPHRRTRKPSVHRQTSFHLINGIRSQTSSWHQCFSRPTRFC